MTRTLFINLDALRDIVEATLRIAIDGTQIVDISVLNPDSTRSEWIPYTRFLADFVIPEGTDHYEP